jgi:hypothetical protein
MIESEQNALNHYFCHFECRKKSLCALHRSKRAITMLLLNLAARFVVREKKI